MRRLLIKIDLACLAFTCVAIATIAVNRRPRRRAPRIFTLPSGLVAQGACQRARAPVALR